MGMGAVFRRLNLPQLLGMLLRGLANYNETVSQEAFMVIGQHIFGSPL